MRNVIEHFEGYVTQVCDDTFWVEFEDIAGNMEMAEVITDKVLNDEEREYLQQGAIFDWIFFSDESNQFIFYKERWTKEEIEHAEREAKRLVAKFKSLPYCED